VVDDGGPSESQIDDLKTSEIEINIHIHYLL